MDRNAPTCGRILLACSPDSEPTLRSALDPLEAEIVSAFAHDAAKDELEAGVDLVVCSLRFDESRMLDFIAEAARERPSVPFVCCHVRGGLPIDSLRAAFTAAGHLGAVAIVDFPQVARRESVAQAEAMLRGAVLAHLGHDARHASMS
jgi:hypothetical protein